MFQAPKLTNVGKALYYSNIDGEPIVFTSIQMGSGTLSGSIANLVKLVRPVVTLTAAINRYDDYIDVSGKFSNAGLNDGFYWREIGVFAANPDDPDNRAADILYCYQNAYDTADFIAPASVETIEKNITVPIIVGDASAVSCTLTVSQILATLKDLEDHNTSAEAHPGIFISSSQKGTANGVATLDANSKVPAAQLPTTATQTEAQAGTSTTVRSWTPQRVAQAVRGGILTGLSVATNMVITATDTVLTAIGKLQAQITAFKEEKGAANGLATLDNAGKVPSGQLPAMDYIPTDEKAAPNGVATLDTGGELVQVPATMGRVYTTLEQLGFTDADMSETDTDGNVAKIINAMAVGGSFRFSSLGNSNLTKSLVVWFHESGWTDVANSLRFAIKVDKMSNDVALPHFIEILANGLRDTGQYKWWAKYDNNLSQPFRQWKDVQIIVGRSTANGWFKIASYTRLDTEITSAGFTAHIARHSSRSAAQTLDSGRIKVLLRAGSGAIESGTKIYWEYANSGINTEDFVIAYKLEGGVGIYDIWVRNRINYSYLVINVDWGKVGSASLEPFNRDIIFYENPAPVTAIPEDFIQIPSTLLPIKEEHTYHCTGTADSTAIAAIINDFFANGTAMTMKLTVKGTMGLAFTSSAAMFIDSENVRGAVCHVDFRDCQILDIATTSRDVLRIPSTNAKLKIEGLNVKTTRYAAISTLGQSEKSIVFEDCRFESTGDYTIGMWSSLGTYTFVRCKLKSTIRPFHLNDVTNVVVHDCELYGEQGGANFFSCGGHKIIDCDIYAEDGPAATLSSAYDIAFVRCKMHSKTTYGAYLYAGSEDNLFDNCEISSEASSSVYVNSAPNTKFRNCKIKGDISRFIDYVEGIRINASDNIDLDTCEITGIYAIRIIGSSFISINKCDIYSTGNHSTDEGGGNGLRIYGTCNHVSVKDTVIKGDPVMGIFCGADFSGTLTLINCKVLGYAYSGVRCASANLNAVIKLIACAIAGTRPLNQGSAAPSMKWNIQGCSFENSSISANGQTLTESSTEASKFLYIQAYDNLFGQTLT